jgi:hypothetical protein
VALAPHVITMTDAIHRATQQNQVNMMALALSHGID